MDSEKYLINKIKQDIVENNLQIKAIIQDINNCKGPLSELHSLNSTGRQKIAAFRKQIDQLGDIAKENKDDGLLKEVLLHRQNLAISMETFKKANIRSMLAIEQSNREQLMKPKNDETALRQRQKRDRASLVNMNSNVTDQLLSISRQLADTTQRSADTLDTLTVSSSTVHGTKDELLVTSDTIGQSGKLLAKYGRREFTDKLLMFFAFALFIACVLYVVQKRLF